MQPWDAVTGRGQCVRFQDPTIHSCAVAAFRGAAMTASITVVGLRAADVGVGVSVQSGDTDRKRGQCALRHAGVSDLRLTVKGSVIIANKGRCGQIGVPSAAWYCYTKAMRQCVDDCAASMYGSTVLESVEFVGFGASSFTAASGTNDNSDFPAMPPWIGSTCVLGTDGNTRESQFHASNSRFHHYFSNQAMMKLMII